jgi:hypothetical protein
MLCSDPPFGRGLAAALKIGDELPPVGNDLGAGIGRY